MGILRSAQQVALQGLYRLAQESVDHYRDSAEFVEDTTLTQLFTRIADQRESLANSVAQAIRDTDDLPAAPDADRETGEQLIHRLHAWFTADQTRDVLQQRLQAEEELATALTQSRDESSDLAFRQLHQQFAGQVTDVTQSLRQAMA
jgi:primase-polymerase (primpol)-like protein